MNTKDVEEFIKKNQIDAELKILAPESTRTSELAAKAVGCSVAEIAKSIVFYYFKDSLKNAAIVVLSGDKKVNEEKLIDFLQADDVRKMSAEEVKEETGYTIGGVPPFPHRAGVRILIDKSLFRFRRVWSAAGSANAVMKLSPEMLINKLHMEPCYVSD